MVTFFIWWSRGESNPRPECLRIEGITTIKLFNSLYAKMSSFSCSFWESLSGRIGSNQVSGI